MKKFRNYRLVCAGLNFLGGAFRLIAALVEGASKNLTPPSAW